MKSRLTVAEVFRRYGEKFLEINPRLPQFIKFALWSLARCQTPLLGGHIVQCDQCGVKEHVYNSCRHRACPQCEGAKCAKWMSERVKDLLPVHYFHVVFTLPHTLNGLVFSNSQACYNLLFASVKRTLLTVGQNNLKANIGFFAILHTWGQKLGYHPHLHCVVPGGGISLDGKSWIHSSKNKHYFVPEKVLIAVFQGIFIRGLRKLHQQKKLSFNGDIERLFVEACAKKWVVHCKPPFSGPVDVIKYLARYTRKVAISNSRLVSLQNHNVTFTFNDYADCCKRKNATLSAFEFIRRFLLHIPKPKFIRIRHFGFLANGNKKKSLELCRKLLAQSTKDKEILTKVCTDTIVSARCQHCMKGTLCIIANVARVTLANWDSS